MRSIAMSLCWKEFHELKWSAASAAAIVLSIPLGYVFRDYNAALLGVYTGLWAYPLFAGTFFGMRAAAGERSSRSAVFVAGLPVSHRLLGAVRLVAAILAAAAPLVALLLFGLILRPLADIHTLESLIPLEEAFGWSLLATGFGLTVAAVAGLGQPTEVRAGAVGFAAILLAVIVSWIAFMSSMQWLGEYLALDTQHRLLRMWATGIPLVASLLVGVSFALNYSRALAPLAEQGIRRWTINAWRPTPIPAPVAALIWKGAREMGVLGLQVFVISLVLSLVAGALGLTGNDPATTVELATKTLPAILWAGGFVLAVLVGVGAVIGDLQGGVNTFWRSRPIPPQAWYWTKFAIGLATILITIEIPFWLSPGATDLSNDKGLLWWPLTWNVTFSFALTATCLIRQPAHSAILAVGAAGILYAAIQALFGSFTPGEPGAPMAVLAPVFLAAFVVSTFVGSWAAEHDVAIS